MDVVSLTSALVRCESVTPKSAGALELLAEYLTAAGFSCERIDGGDTGNLWATHGSGSPLVAFNGHVDVVPPGPLAAWTSPPFEPEERDGHLYGRGTADMKGSVAAMTLAAIDSVGENPSHPGTIGLLFTSDEEGPATFGTAFALDELISRGVKIDSAIVGEPTSADVFGDTLKVGRRGSLSGELTLTGTQGHVAYPHLAKNPIHDVPLVVSTLLGLEFDAETIPPFPKTSLQFSNIHGGTGAKNVIPGEVQLSFNLRYSPATTALEIRKAIEAALNDLPITYTLAWDHSAEAFLTREPKLLAAVASAVKKHTGLDPIQDAGGGTSDARCFAAAGIPVVEFGPINKTIHAVDECVSTEDLSTLRRIFADCIQSLLK